MKRVRIMASAAVCAASVATIVLSPAVAQFKPSLDESSRIANEAKASQQRINQLDDQTAVLVNDFRANLKQLEANLRYNASRQREVEAQERKIAQLRTDIENVSGLQKSTQPLMEDMLAKLGAIVQADLPFNLDDRRARVDRLTAAMSNPDISAAQRYRLIVEAYQIENEFGRTIGSYEGVIDDNGTARTGDFLRIGRIALVFKTEDDSILKIYDVESRSFVDLSKSFLQDVKLGMRMAKEQTAPNLLPIPVKRVAVDAAATE
ncbi:MAG: DUF3450 domain-containing protein [Pseudomonadota bacterium]